MLFGYLNLKGMPEFDYNMNACSRPFTMRVGELELQLTEEQMTAFANLSNNVLLDYDKVQKEKEK